jgi:hypothetical protein
LPSFVREWLGGGSRGARALLALATSLFFGVGAARADAPDRWETLQAINLVENPTNSSRMGRHGELGPYQFRVGTWKMHTKKPFYLATNRAEADRVAVKHYDWLTRQLERNGIQPTAYHIALAWNAGLSAVVRDRAPSRSHEYASRVEALTEDLKRRQLVRDP